MNELSTRIGPIRTAVDGEIFAADYAGYGGASEQRAHFMADAALRDCTLGGNGLPTPDAIKFAAGVWNAEDNMARRRREREARENPEPGTVNYYMKMGRKAIQAVLGFIDKTLDRALGYDTENKIAA